MNDQPSLFDVAAGITARDKAIAQVEANADPTWKTQARNAIRWLVRSRLEFTTDDVWQEMADRRYELPREPRAIGALMVEAAREGLIEATDRYVPSARPDCHRRPVKVWRVR